MALAILTGWACQRSEEEPNQVSAAAASSTEAQPDRPRLGPDEVDLVERSRLASAGRWSDARSALVDADSRLYVLDAVVPVRILKFDTDGSYMLRFGEGEPDPDQVVVAQRMSLAPDWNTLLLVDRSEVAVSTFLTLGMLTYSVMVTGGGIPIDVLGMPRLGEYYLQAWDQSRSRSGVYHMRLPIDTLATTYEVAIAPYQPVRKTARDVYFHIATDDRGRLYVGFHDDYPVRVLEPDGSSVRLIGIQRPPVVKRPEAVAAETARDLAKLRREAPDLPDSMLVASAQADSLLPMIEELAVDPSHRLWVRTHRADGVGSTPYDVFDEEGRYLARVDVPGDVRATGFAPDGSLVVIDVAADPAGAVVRYDVRLGGVPSPAVRDSTQGG